MSKKSKTMSFDEWIEFGVANGYCSEQFCNTHDGGPSSATEEELWNNGSDPCAHYVRLGTPEDWEIDAKYFIDLT